MKKGIDLINYIIENNLKDKLITDFLNDINLIVYNRKIPTKRKYLHKNTFIENETYFIVKTYNSNINDYIDVFIDKEDKEKISKYNWIISKKHKYPVIKIKNKVIPMHRYILNYNGDKVIDHINRNKLDNRKNNLRIVTNIENVANNNAIGVYRQNNKWFTTVTRYGKTYDIGRFDTFDEASKARIEKINEIEKNKEKLIDEYLKEKEENGPGIRKMKSGNWFAYITCKGKVIRVGTYKTKQEAIDARNNALANKKGSLQ